jgi:uncharacterized protein YaeQ
MSFVAGILRFEFNLNNISEGIYDSLKITLPRHLNEDSLAFYGKILSFCHVYRLGVALSSDTCDERIPQASLTSPAEELLIWMRFASVDSRSLRRICKSYPNCSFNIYFSNQEQILTFCNTLRGANENWVENINFYLWQEEVLVNIAEREKNRNVWNFTLLDDNNFYLEVNGEEYHSQIRSVDIWKNFQYAIS